MKHIFIIGVIGESLIHSSVWRQPVFHAQFLKEEEDFSILESNLDFIFLSSSVEWDQNGFYQMDRLKKNIDRLIALNFHHKIILTSIMPLGAAELLDCHYCPFIFQDRRIFGCNTRIPFDDQCIRSMMFHLFFHYEFLNVRDAEMKCLIELSRHFINESFHKEISIFCSKNNIMLPFFSTSRSVIKRDLIPVLIYIIRQIEETRLDCPLLYSCLFRHHYIDIPILNL